MRQDRPPTLARHLAGPVAGMLLEQYFQPPWSVAFVAVVTDYEARLALRLLRAFRTYSAPVFHGCGLLSVLILDSAVRDACAEIE